MVQLTPVEGDPFAAPHGGRLEPVDGDPFAPRAEQAPGIPQAALDRFDGGAEAHKREGGLLQTLPQFADLIGTPEGRTKLWNAVKEYPAQFAKGMVEQAELPGEVAKGAVDLSTPEGMDKAIGLGTLIGFGRPNKLPLTGKTAGMSMVSGGQMARIERDPLGKIQEQPIGTLPKAEDFSNAVQSLTQGEPAPAAQGKLNKLWEDHGIHPAEAAHDAASDATIKQSLLSDGEDLPEVYTRNVAAKAKQDVIKGEVGDYGEGSAEPRGGGEGEPPAEPPEPPAPGSPEEAQAKVLSKVDVGGRARKQPMSWDKLYTQAVDDLHPLKKLGDDVYELARLTRGQFGKAQQFLEHGTFDFDTYETNGPSLKSVLAPVRDDLDGLRAYLTSKRALEIEASGRKSGIDLDAAKKVIASGRERYEPIAEQLGEYQSKTLDYLKASGVLSAESVEAMRTANQSYVPFYRVMDDASGGGSVGKSLGPGSPIKKLTGSERDVIDPLESIIKNTFAYISVAERNAVGIKAIDALREASGELPHEALPPEARGALDAETADYLKDQGAANTPPELVDALRSAAGLDEGETISAFRGGKKESVKIDDPELLRAFRGLDQQNVNMLTRMLALPAKMLRAGSTLTPEFMARNLFRDFLTAMVNSKGVFTPLDTAKGLASVIRKDADFETWLKSGGANATLVSLDRRYLQESLEKLTADTGLMTRSWNVVRHPLQGMRMLSELAENATRLGEFKKALGESAAKEDIQSAGFASREVTLDFARIGASTRAYNMLTAFANAQIQGVDRLARAFQEKPVATTAKIAGGITLPSVLLWFANHDDPRYKELPQWERDLFWIVMTKDHIYRVPKPFEIGVMFGSGAERVLDATIGNNPEAFDHFSKSVMGALLPSAVPTVAVPLVEQYANRSTFTDRTLIPADMEKHLPEYQYTPYTTELTKALGKIIGSFPGLRSASLDKDAVPGAAARAVTSPILIENYLRAWTGGLGNYALNAADLSLRKAGILPDPPLPASTLADIPFVKAFVVRYPSASAQSIQDFYDAYERNKVFYDTWMAKAKEGDAEAVARIQAAGGPRMFVQLGAIKTALSEHSQLIREIYKNPGVTADEKRQFIDQLYGSMIAIGQQGKAMLRSSDQAQRSLPQ